MKQNAESRSPEIGLDHAIAAETRLSYGDPDTGLLVIRGRRIEELAGVHPYETVVGLLWEELLPGPITTDRLGTARAAAFGRFRPLAGSLGDLRPVEAQRFLLSSIPEAQADPLLVAAAAGVATAIALRVAAGSEPIPPDTRLGHAADLLRMISGRVPETAESAALDAYLVAMVDHGVSASTLAARVAASTGAGLMAGVLAALSTLQGPLHGGAPGLVLDMFDDIGTTERAQAWVEAMLDRRERLMGFGSRAYRIRDPRADILKTALLRLPHPRRRRVAFAEAVEDAALRAVAARKPDRILQTNVEFYAAPLLEALGLPRSGFTPIFAAARCAGWVAHVREQEQVGRMLRPDYRYVGPQPL